MNEKKCSHEPEVDPTAPLRAIINKGERRGLQGTSKSVTSTIGDDDVIQAVELLEVEAI
jgi:hypothetical protein